MPVAAALLNSSGRKTGEVESSRGEMAETPNDDERVQEMTDKLRSLLHVGQYRTAAGLVDEEPSTPPPKAMISATVVGGAIPKSTTSIRGVSTTPSKPIVSATPKKSISSTGVGATPKTVPLDRSKNNNNNKNAERSTAQMPRQSSNGFGSSEKYRQQNQSRGRVASGGQQFGSSPSNGSGRQWSTARVPFTARSPKPPPFLPSFSDAEDDDIIRTTLTNVPATDQIPTIRLPPPINPFAMAFAPIPDVRLDSTNPNSSVPLVDHIASNFRPSFSTSDDQSDNGTYIDEQRRLICVNENAKSNLLSELFNRH